MNLGVLKDNKGKKVTFADLCFLIMGFGSLIFWYANGMKGNDFWWHVKAGEYICKTGKIPTNDFFSWVNELSVIPWTAHEWLSEIILYLLYHYGGQVGVFLIFFMLACLSYYLVYAQVRIHAKNNYAFSGLFLFFYSVVAPMFYFGRPHVFSFFLFFFELKILYSFYEKDGGKQIWFIPLIAVLWSNLHGGSSNLSYLLCLMFLFAGSFSFSVGRVEGQKISKKSRKTLALVTVCTAAAIFVNPIGLKVFAFPYINIGDKLSMALVREWQNPDIKEIGQLILLFFPIALLFVGFVSEEKMIRLVDLLVMGFFVYLFLRSVRFIILWYLAAAFCAFPYFPKLDEQMIKQKWWKIAGEICMICGLLLGIGGMVTAVKTIQSGKIIETVLGEKMIQTIKEASPKHLFNHYDFGETLIFHDLPVFFDSRADMYAKTDVLADGFGLIQLQNLNPNAGTDVLDVEGIMEKYQFDYFVVNSMTPIYVYLTDHSEKYELLFEEENAAFFAVKASGE